MAVSRFIVNMCIVCFIYCCPVNFFMLKTYDISHFVRNDNQSFLFRRGLVGGEAANQPPPFICMYKSLSF